MQTCARTLMTVTAALFLSTGASAQVAGCQALPVVEDSTRLTQLSDIWFGDGSFRYSIMLATNARVGQSGIQFISDINSLPIGAPVCVPEIGEAEKLKRRYDRYLEAVQDMALAEPFEVVDTLDPLPQSGTYRLASWIRSDQVGAYGPSPGNFTPGWDVWVTLEPHLQNFCKAYVSEISDDPKALTLRLEQRLGLGPTSSKTHFVIFEVDAAGSGSAVFRPCGDPATGTTSCNVGFPKNCDAGCEAHRGFFLNQYYSAFGTAHPVEFPWTSLGYTFDWAPRQIGLGGEVDYIRVGESEYVVPSGTPINLVEIVTTEDYCTD